MNIYRAEVERLKGELAAARWQLEGLCVGIEHAVQDGDTDNAFLLRLASETRANQVRAAPAKEETCNQSTSSSSHGSSPASASSPSPLSCPPSCGASTGVEAPAAPYEPTDEEVERGAVALSDGFLARRPNESYWDERRRYARAVLCAALRAVPPREVVRYRVHERVGRYIALLGKQREAQIADDEQAEEVACSEMDTLWYEMTADELAACEGAARLVSTGTRYRVPPRTPALIEDIALAIGKVPEGTVNTIFADADRAYDALVAHVGDAGVVDAETVERVARVIDVNTPDGDYDPRPVALAVLAALGLKVAP